MEQVTTSEIWDYHPGHVRIFVVRGDLDAYLSTDLRDRLERALTETPDVLFVDLEDVTFMDASAVAVLVAASKKARASGAVLRLVAPSDPAAPVTSDPYRRRPSGRERSDHRLRAGCYRNRRARESKGVR